MKELDDDIVGLMCRRAYDVAGSTKGVKVLLNGKVLPVSTAFCNFFHSEINRSGHNISSEGKM